MDWTFDFGSLFILNISFCFLAFSASCFCAFWLTFPFLLHSFSFKVLASSTMSLFLSDSTIDMGGSDSGGSFEQPIMDREVISIGGSLSEDTYRGASDSKSSSSERVRASRCTGESTSHPHGRARPSTTSGEPVPIM